MSIAAYVKSQTLIGDGKHSEGVKIVEIVRANIPVKNGVVHFISKPLMIVDGTVDQFLQVRSWRERINRNWGDSHPQ